MIITVASGQCHNSYQIVRHNCLSIHSKNLTRNSLENVANTNISAYSQTSGAFTGPKLLAVIVDVLLGANIHVQRLIPYLIATWTSLINQGT